MSGRDALSGRDAPDGLVVRPMTAADAEAVAAIYTQGIEDRTATFETAPRTASDVAGWPDQGPVVVVERDGAVVGWASTSAYRPNRAAYAHIREFSVYVDRAARGAGVGRVALTGLLALCPPAGVRKLVSRIFPENTGSLALCRSLGFREVGTYHRHGMLDGAWKDVVVVELLLDE
ncbi:arsinothricin resistance N-acetyltransferase ArsN1 family A [Kineosporia sp. R_H_3]|uniref:arsinothricin resistance N-acetyltransferase ArsN1 family A n=1 Tax=Kineosporia sp. R_H_3 TaxID=1961848 RepID=UPI0018EA2BF6|nr:arsinothricin resistance N-acetyltransferase ArsN1 family A [Kineosporia sp. R_H_3]